MRLTNCLSCFTTIEIQNEAHVGQHVTCEICEREWKITRINPIELDPILFWHQRPRSFSYDESDEVTY